MGTEETYGLEDSTVDNESTEFLFAPRTPTSRDRLGKFLEIYARTGAVIRSCELAGIAFKTHYRRLERDPAYRRAFYLAEQGIAQKLEDAAVEQALEGDTQLLIVLLKRFKPEYRDRISADLSVTVHLAEELQQARARLIALEENDVHHSAA